MKLNIKLEEAKRAIAIHDFKREDLLIIALTEPSDLNNPYLFSTSERIEREKIYRRLAFLGDALFEVFVDVIFIDRQKNFLHLSQWLIDNFIHTAVGIYLNDPDYNGMITSEEYAEMIGLPYYWGWLPGDDDN